MPASCVREVVMDAGEKPTVVVECVISNTSPQILHLRYTKGARKKDYEVVTEAEAALLDLTDGSEAGRFAKAEDGVWTLDYEAKEKHEYRLEVSVPGYDLITAEQRMPLRPYVVAMRALCGISLAGYDPHECEWSYSCYYDIDTTHNYGNNSLWIYAMNYDSIDGRREISEYICSNPSSDDFNLTDSVYSPQTDTVTHVFHNFMPRLCIAGLYPEMYGRRMHDKFLRFQTWPEQIKITGSFKGFYPMEIDKERGYHKRYLIDDGYLSEPADDQGYLVFASISDEYEKYHMETFRFQELEESSKLSDIYLRDNVFSNINGGLGIFGAKAETKMVWSEKPKLAVIQQQ